MPARAEHELTPVNVANWSPDLVVGIPTAYFWAFIRAVPPQRAFGTIGSAGMDTASVEDVFRASLHAVKGR